MAAAGLVECCPPRYCFVIPACSNMFSRKIPYCEKATKKLPRKVTSGAAILFTAWAAAKGRTLTERSS